MGYTAGSAKLLNQSIDNVVPATWFLSGTDTDATVLAAGYISDAQHLGMKKNDIVQYLRTDTSALYIHVVTAVASTGATLGSSPATSS